VTGQNSDLINNLTQTPSPPRNTTTKTTCTTKGFKIIQAELSIKVQFNSLTKYKTRSSETPKHRLRLTGEHATFYPLPITLPAMIIESLDRTTQSHVLRLESQQGFTINSQLKPLFLSGIN